MPENKEIVYSSRTQRWTPALVCVTGPAPPVMAARTSRHRCRCIQPAVPWSHNFEHCVSQESQLVVAPSRRSSSTPNGRSSSTMHHRAAPSASPLAPWSTLPSPVEAFSIADCRLFWMPVVAFLGLGCNFPHRDCSFPYHWSRPSRHQLQLHRGMVASCRSKVAAFLMVS